MGFRWYGKDTERTLPFLLDFKLCNRGTSKSIHNAMQLRDEMYETDIRIFDYHYHISAGNYHHRYKQTVFFVQSQLLGLPEMATLLNQLAAVLRRVPIYWLVLRCKMKRFYCSAMLFLIGSLQLS